MLVADCQHPLTLRHNENQIEHTVWIERLLANTKLANRQLGRPRKTCTSSFIIIMQRTYEIIAPQQTVAF